MRAQLQWMQVFVHRLRKYLGSYLIQLADCEDVCIVFSAGIGENSALIRSMACQHLQVRALLHLHDRPIGSNVNGSKRYGHSM